MSTLVGILVLLPLCESNGSTSVGDLLRAHQFTPSSSFKGKTATEIAQTLNGHFRRSFSRSAPCTSYDLAQLRSVQRELFMIRSPELQSVYDKRPDDGRAMPHMDLPAFEMAWDTVESLAEAQPSLSHVLRDARCYETMNWFVHQLPKSVQKGVRVVLPLLPTERHSFATEDDTTKKIAANYASASPCLICHSIDSDWNDTAPGGEQPVLASQFHVSFSETTKESPLSGKKTNFGSFHLDAENHRMAWVHGKGHGDVWCQCAGLQTNEECHLISSPSSGEGGGGATYVVFKSLNKCCKLGNYAQGFGPLRPDWLQVSNATKFATVKVGGKTCTTWSGGPPGDSFNMISDLWSVDEEGLPCQYQDQFKWWSKLFLGSYHVIVFNSSSYAEAPEEDDVFSIPANCEDHCQYPKSAATWCDLGDKKEIMV